MPIIAGQRHSLRVELGVRTGPLNAKVELRTGDGELLAYREVCRTEGWGCQTPPVALCGCPPGSYMVRATVGGGRVIERPVTTSSDGPNVVRIR